MISPCTGVCKLDDATGWCLGCGRTGAEVAGWAKKTREDRTAIWDGLPARLQQLGISYRRLPWSTHDIIQFVVQSLEQRTGCWVMGVVGAVAEFSPALNEPVTVASTDSTITAHTLGGSMHMVIDERIRVLEFQRSPANAGPPRIALVVPVEAHHERFEAGFTQDLGKDTEALIPEVASRLFDLGLGRKAARFCVRVAPGAAHTALKQVIGQPFAQSLAKAGAELIVECPTRIVESPIGRIEVAGSIPSPDQTSPDGPHTHLLPEHLALERNSPVDIDVPEAYLPAALFYPV
ncbi:MAG: DUF1289 domain-containing protein [Pseudomonadota bacterium]